MRSCSNESKIGLYDKWADKPQLVRPGASPVIQMTCQPQSEPVLESPFALTPEATPVPAPAERWHFPLSAAEYRVANFKKKSVLAQCC